MENKTRTLSVPTNPMGRRGFLASALGGLSLAFTLPEAGRVFGVKAATGPDPAALANAYIHIGTDNSITLMFGGSEMGQGIKTGLAQILAEELMVDWGQVAVQQSKVDPVVTYVTGGSGAVSGRYKNLRTAGAAARELLIQAAMQITGDTARDHYSAASAQVLYNGATPQSWTYGSLAAAAMALAAPTDLRLTDPSNFRLIGKPVPRVDIPSKVDGSAKFGIDIWFPDMVFGVIKHCPVFGGTLAATPTKPSAAIAVVPCKASDNRGAVVAGSVNAVAVVASNTWLAKNLANQLSVKWNLPASTAGVDSAQIAAQAQSLLATGAALVGEPAVPAGYTPATYASVIEAQVDSAMGAPSLDATYQTPYLAHATMEVLNCSVRLTYSDAAKTTVTKCEVWAPTQAASWVAGTAAALINAAQPAPIAASAIEVNTTFLGGGLGRKIEQDYVSQAIQVALAVKQPVKLTWMREEDTAHDNFRPMALVRVRAKLNAGSIAAWSVRNVSQAILGQRGWLPPGAVDSQAVEGAVKLPYALGTKLTEWVPLPVGIPVGFWRSVGSSINTFAVECAIDELAQQAGLDPFAFRYNLISDARRLAVLKALDQMTGWRMSLPPGHAWGIAMSEWNGTIVCELAEVVKTTSGISIPRVACAVDCGQVINPNQAEAQMQGGIVHGLNATLYGQITFTAGKANQTNFRNYRMIRLNEMPVITVQLLPSTNSPSGLGEPAVPPIASAIANAWSRLTGTRARSLPLFPGATMSGL